MDQLRHATLLEYPLFTFDGLKTYGKILSIYDGDTCDLAILHHNNNILHIKARLYGYDAPEMKLSANMDTDTKQQKKELAINSRNRLWTLCTSSDTAIQYDAHTHIIKVVCHEFDKYGRVLVTLFSANIDDNDLSFFDKSINHMMILDGHGYEYYGGTKKR